MSTTDRLQLLLRVTVRRVPVGKLWLLLSHNRRQRRPDRAPVQLVLVLLAVEAVSQPDAPYDVEVSAGAGHDVPVEMLESSQEKDLRCRLTTSHGLQVECPKAGRVPSSSA